MYKTRSIFRLKTEEKKRQKCEVHNNYGNQRLKFQYIKILFEFDDLQKRPNHAYIFHIMGI